MPFYDYRCDKCGHVFEVLAKVDAPDPPCPRVLIDDEAIGVPTGDGHCEGATTKIIGASTFHLAGTGWAKDGYSG